MQSYHSAPKGDPPLRAAIPKRPRGGCEPASPRVRAAPDRSSESGDNAGDLPRRTSKRLPAPAKAPQRDPLRPRNRALFAAKNNRQRRRPYRPANLLAFPPGILRGIHNGIRLLAGYLREVLGRTASTGIGLDG